MDSSDMANKNKRALARFTFLYFLFFFIATCGCKKNFETKNYPYIQLRLAGFVSSLEETRLLKKIIDEFQKDNPNIKINYEPVPGNYIPKLLTMIAGGKPPDVFYLDSLYFPDFASKKILLPLDDLIKKEGIEIKDFYSNLILAFTSNNKIYGIPKDFNTLALFYNKEILKSAGLQCPNSHWDWNSLRRAALTVTRAGKGRYYGLSLPTDQPARWLPFAFQNGARVFTKSGKICIDTPQFINSLKFYRDLILKDKVSVSPGEIGAGWAGDALGKGDVAMALEGGWLIPYLETTFPEIKYGCVELPRGPAGRGNLIFTVAYCVSKDSKYPSQALKLIKHLTSYESQIQVTFALPSRIKAGESYIKKYPVYKPIFKAAYYGIPYQFGEKSDKVIDILGVAMQEVFLTGITPKEALEKGQREINALEKI